MFVADLKLLFLKHIENSYGRARHVWVIDRGIPTEEILAEMRDPKLQTFYLVGTLKSKISQHERLCICEGRWSIVPRYTQPDNHLRLLLHHLHLELLAQPPPRITATALLVTTAHRSGEAFCGEDLEVALTEF